MWPIQVCAINDNDEDEEILICLTEIGLVKYLGRVKIKTAQTMSTVIMPNPQ